MKVEEFDPSKVIGSRGDHGRHSFQAQRLLSPLLRSSISLQLRNPHRDLHAAPVHFARLLLHLPEAHNAPGRASCPHLGHGVEGPVQPPHSRSTSRSSARNSSRVSGRWA